MNDLVLKGGRVIDPSQGIDKVTDIAFAAGKVAAVGDGLSAKAERELGYRTRPYGEALTEAIAWFRQNGLLK